MLVDYFLLLFMLRQCMFSVCHVLPRKPCFSPLLSSSRSARQDTPCLSLSTRLMSCQCLYLLPHCLPSQPLPCSAQKEVRQRARGFLCAFRHFLSRFSKYFLPHVSTLFNVVHGRVFAWRVGGVGWHEGTVYCTSSKQKPTPRNCLQMNELSQSGLEKYLTTKWKWAVLCSSPPKQCSVVYMEWSLMTEPGWRGGRNVFGGESCLNQLYKSWPLFVYTRTLCKEHGGLPKGKQGLLTDCKCPEIVFNLKQCWKM